MKKTNQTVLYAYSKEDLENIVESVISRLRKMDVLTESNVPQEDDRITQKEAASLLNISVQTLISWKKKELVPYYQIGRSIFFSKNELLNVARNNPKLLFPTRK